MTTPLDRVKAALATCGDHSHSVNVAVRDLAALLADLDAARVAVEWRLYLDCDGVLADFDRAFSERFGHPPRAYEEQRGAETFWRDIQNDAPGFYRNLPLMPDALELFDAVKHLRPIILTGCPMGGWAEAQKMAWAAEHFPGVPMVTCSSKDKRTYCQPGDVLIDDWPKYRERWEAAGGRFILHTSAADSIAQLLAAPAPKSWSLSMNDTGEVRLTRGQRAMLELAVRSDTGNPWPLIGGGQRAGGAKGRMFNAMKAFGWFDLNNEITPVGRAALEASK